MNEYLDPDSTYTPSDVFRGLRISPSLQEEARRAGHLTFVRDGGVKYRGSWVNRWIADGCPTEPSVSVSVSNCSDSKEEGDSMTYKDPKAVLQERVAAKMRGGKPRHVAHNEVMKEDPQLRQDLLIEANANRPGVQSSIRGIV